MARFTGQETALVYRTAERWRDQCLVEGKSLLWGDEHIWTRENLEDFRKYFTENRDESSASFESKLKKQLDPGGPDLTKLTCELMLVYFLFTESVTGRHKRKFISTIASWKNLQVNEAGSDALASLDHGIGGPGPAYNLRRDREISYLAEVATHLAEKSAPERQRILNDHMSFREFLDGTEEDSSRQGRDVLLHLLFPDKYERIASRTHKQLIADTFGEVLDSATVPETPDDRLFAIRERLQSLLGRTDLDFYNPPLRECWFVANESDDLSPLQGLSIKQQVVLYGPPGTGKTFEARALAKGITRQGLLKAWGPKRYFGAGAEADKLLSDRVRAIQFHPGYAYEDFVRGLQLVDGGRTEYRDGVLLRIISKLRDDSAELSAVPFVLILDEMNRADLSKVLGECFSLLEDREVPVQLAGQDEAPRKVSLPTNLYLIGTMNLIDQSLEQIDFALRRRFLWYYRGFDQGQFLGICKTRWDRLKESRRVKREWDKVEDEFGELADRAEQINQLIADHHSLGPHYQIGHTYFCDVVDFVQKDLAINQGRRTVLFGQNGSGRDKTVGVLWRYSLRPLLEQYLSGVDATERKSFVLQIEKALIR